MKKTIGIDIDGTLCDIYPAWLGEYNLAYADNLTIDDFKDYHMAKYAKGGKAIYKLRHPAMYTQSKPYALAMTVVALLADQYRIVAITHDVELFVEAKTNWIRTWFPDIKEVLFEQNGHKNDHGVDMLIDDAPHNIDQFPLQGILIDRPWNRQFQKTIDTRHKVCYDWKHIGLELGVLPL